MITSKKRATIILSVLILLIVLNYLPPIYYNLINRGGGYLKSIDYGYDNIPYDAFIKKIRDIDTNKVNVYILSSRTDTFAIIPADSLIRGKINCYLNKSSHIAFYDKTRKVYYHAGVEGAYVYSAPRVDFLFGYVTKSLDKNDKGKRINKDYDYITNYIVKKNFENLVIENLNGLYASYVRELDH